MEEPCAAILCGEDTHRADIIHEAEVWLASEMIKHRRSLTDHMFV